MAICQRIGQDEGINLILVPFQKGEIYLSPTTVSQTKQGINLDELQQEAEKLLTLLKDRQPGLMGWNQFMMERLQNLHTLTSTALSKKNGAEGEFFQSRGIGIDRTPGCFVCGGSEGVNSNIAAFVESKEAGERVVDMFMQGARLDYRPHEPQWIQVKIGACDTHLPRLKKLDELTSKRKLIRMALIRQALKE